MTTTSSRPFIAAMQVTLDGHIVGPDGEADWVDSWADALELLPEVDAFVLGGGMFPDYKQFWATILDNPAAASEWLGRGPYPRELAYAAVAADKPLSLAAGYQIVEIHPARRARCTALHRVGFNPPTRYDNEPFARHTHGLPRSRSSARHVNR